MTIHGVTRVVVTGSESTGKTSLARELASYFGAVWVAEQARGYAERVNRSLTSDDVSLIASEQIAAEDAALTEAIRLGNRWLFLDTDLLSTVVYAHHYYGACPPWVEAEARARRGDLYLLADIDVPWTPDGVRDRPGSREELHEEFRKSLAEIGAPSRVVQGTGEQRLTMAIKEVEAYARTSPAK